MVAQIDKHYRTFGFSKTLRRYVSYILFEGRPATTKGQWFNPFVFSWLRILAKFPGSPAVNKPIFITGLGRSGTTILGVLLSLHPDVGFLNEPKAMWHVIDPRQDINGNYGYENGQYRLGHQDVSNKIVQLAHKVFGRYLSFVSTSRLVDKYPEHIFRIEYINKIFPDAHFIFIYRNGVDACQSIDKWSQRLGVERRGVVEDWWGRADFKWLKIWQEIILKDGEYEEVAMLGSDSFDHINRAALEWVVTMREGLRQSIMQPDKLFMISYEEILADPENKLKQLMKFCELHYEHDVVRYARKTLYKNPPKQLPGLMPSVEKIFEKTMVELGYLK